MANLLRMDTGHVHVFSSRYMTALDEMEQQVQAARNNVSAVNWISPAREEFVSDFGQLATQIQSLIEQGREYSRRVNQESSQWEAMAVLSSAAATPSTGEGGGDGGGGAGPGNPDYSNTEIYKIFSPLKYTDYLEKIDDIGSIVTPAALFFALHMAKSGAYSIRASKFVKQWVLDLNPARTMISNANVTKMATEMGKFGPLDASLFGLNFAADLYENGKDGLDLAEAGSILAVDAAQVAAGAVIGQIIFPVPGVGAAIGVAVTKVAFNVITDVDILPGGMSIKDVSIDAVHNSTHWVIDRISGK